MVIDIIDFKTQVLDYLTQEEATKAKIILDSCVPWNLEDHPEVLELQAYVNKLMDFPYDDKPDTAIPMETYMTLFRAMWCVEKIPKKSRVFSFGVGGAELETYLTIKHDCNVTGFHPCKEYCESLTNFTDITMVNELPEMIFCDYFMIFEVLEHMTDDSIQWILEKARRNSNNILITVPIGPLQQGDRNPYDFTAFEHIRVFTESSLRKLLEKNGMKILELKTFMRDRQIVCHCVRAD